MTSIPNEQYWFGFRQTIPKPPGSIVVCGPYKSLQEATLARHNAKAWDASVSEPFTAASKADAAARAEALMGGGL